MENQFKMLAAQLSCPSGEQGIKLGHIMNMSNLSVILNGITNLQIQPQDSILELGYGNGGLLSYILSLADNIKYTGLEVSATMHQEAVKLNQPYLDANMAYYQLYDGTVIPFLEQTFDKILTVNTLYFWQKPRLLLENICRVLKSTGLFCLTFCDKNFMQTLPFIEYGFQLYDIPDIKQLTHKLPLVLIYEDHKKDKCISKSGILVERNIISLVFQKL